MAETVYERHALLSGWLIELGVDREMLRRMPARWSMTSARKALKH